MAKKPAAVHFNTNNAPLCSVKAAAPVMSSNAEEVTCKRCLKALAKVEEPAAVEDDEDEPMENAPYAQEEQVVLSPEEPFDWEGEMSDEEWQEHLDEEFADEDM